MWREKSRCRLEKIFFLQSHAEFPRKRRRVEAKAAPAPANKVRKTSSNAGFMPPQGAADPPEEVAPWAWIYAHRVPDSDTLLKMLPEAVEDAVAYYGRIRSRTLESSLCLCGDGHRTPSGVAARFGFELPEVASESETPIDATAYVTRAVCAARSERTPPELNQGRSLYSVGGFVQLTVMRLDKIETSIIHRWPDKIGQLIDGAAGEPVPGFLCQP